MFGNVECECFAARGGQGLFGKVDGELIAFVGFDFFEKLVNLFFGQHDGQEAVFVAVVEEDVGEAGGDDGAETVVVQCPRGVFARGAAAEVFARQQDLRALVTRLVQREIGVQRAFAVVHARFAVVEVTPFVKGIGTEAAAFDGFQKLFGDDGVGIDVAAVERGNDGGNFGKGFHVLYFCIVEDL